MWKKLFSTFALSLFLAGPALSEETTITVEVPVVTADADREAVILAAAEEACGSVKLVGVQRFYAARVKKDCVANAVESAVITTPEGEILAYADFAASLN